MRSAVEKLECVLRTIDGLIRWVVVFALLLMTAVLFFNSIARSVFNVSFVGGPALGRLLVIWLTFLGAYLAVRSGSHITVDLLQRLVPARVIEKLSIPIGLLGATTTAYVSWLSAMFTWTRFSAGQIDPMLEIPSGIFYLPVPIGSGLMTLAFLRVALQSVVGGGSIAADSGAEQPSPTPWAT